MANGATRRGPAFDAFYLRHYPAIVHTAFLVVHDGAMAEELAQDAFVQLYVHWPKVEEYEQPQAWVRRVVIRLAVRAARRNRRALELWSRAVVEAPSEPAPDVDVMRAVAALPAAQRAAVALYYYEDLPVAEVAEAMGRSSGAVKLLLHRARRSLAHTLQMAEVSDAD